MKIITIKRKQYSFRNSVSHVRKVQLGKNLFYHIHNKGNKMINMNRIDMKYVQVNFSKYYNIFIDTYNYISVQGKPI